MSALCLVRRKNQLALLHDAAEARLRARIVRPKSSTTSVPVQTRFLALEPEALILEWPINGSGEVLAAGVPVDVQFEKDGNCYAVRTQTQGRVWWMCPRRGQIAAWQLSLPLRVERREQRSKCRVSLAGMVPVRVNFVSVDESDLRFNGRLVNLSAGGLGVVVPAAEQAEVGIGELLRVEFELPDDVHHFEFIVRCAHAHAVEPSGSLVMGCTFCPTEDPLLYRAHVERIEAFVRRRQAELHPTSLDGEEV